MPNFLKLSLLSILVSFTLTACDNNTSTQTTKTEKTSTEVKAEATPSTNNPTSTDVEKQLIKSPYMDFQVSANRAMLVADLKAEHKLTPEQQACLLSLEGNTSYLAVLEPYFKGILNDDEIKEADTFFATDAGRKFTEIMLRQMGAENLPPFVEPTEQEKAEIAQALLKPFFVKVKAKTDAMTDEQVAEFASPIYKKEMARCKIL